MAEDTQETIAEKMESGVAGGISTVLTKIESEDDTDEKGDVETRELIVAELTKLIL